jgi:hypothetical protein
MSGIELSFLEANTRLFKDNAFFDQHGAMVLFGRNLKRREETKFFVDFLGFYLTLIHKLDKKIDPRKISISIQI